MRGSRPPSLRPRPPHPHHRHSQPCELSLGHHKESAGGGGRHRTAFPLDASHGEPLQTHLRVHRPHLLPRPVLHSHAAHSWDCPHSHGLHLHHEGNLGYSLLLDGGIDGSRIKRGDHSYSSFLGFTSFLLSHPHPHRHLSDIFSPSIRKINIFFKVFKLSSVKKISDCTVINI